MNINNESGCLIAIEGIDGSGKTTQIDLLSAFFTQHNLAHEVISFPRYENNLYGKLIKRYLKGEFGSKKQTSPYLVALAYAGDRFLAKFLIESWIKEGKIVIANRYTSSNKAHMGANLEVQKQEEFMRWIDKLEFETNGIPKVNLTILLSVDAKLGQQNVKNERGSDIHEDNLKHLEEAAKIYLELSKAEQNWEVVDCMQGGKMKDKDIINQDIRNILNAYLHL